MHNKFIVKSGNFFFRYRNYLFPSFFIFFFMFSRPALFLNNSNLDKLVIISGVIVALVGEALRLLVIGFAYIKRGGKDGKVYADNLVKEGIYAHLRNPMYVSNFLIIVGIGMIYGSVWVYFLVIPFFLFVYISIIFSEENYLYSRFGEKYLTYCRQVNRFIPDLRNLKKSLGKYRYDWRKALRKDYGTLFGTLVGCYGTFLWKRYCFNNFSFKKEVLFSSVLVFIIFALGYVAVRYLKKSGRLASPSYG